MVVPEARKSAAWRLVLGAGTPLRRLASSRRSAGRLRHAAWPGDWRNSVIQVP